MKVSSVPVLAMALSLSLGSFSACFADGLLDSIVKDSLHITGTALDGAGSIVAGTVDAAGNVIDASGHMIGKVVMPGGTNNATSSETVVMLGTTNDVYGYSIVTRRHDLIKAVDTAESRGLINHSQAADLRNDLDRVAANEASAQRQHNLTFDESVSLARDLDRINTRLATAVNVQPFDSLVATDSSGNLRMFVTSPRQLTADRKVTRTRSVTQDGVTTTTTTTSTSSGTPSSTAFYSVLDARRYQLDRMIGDAVERRALQADRADKMQADLNRVRTELLSIQTTGTPMSQEQALSLASQLDTMDSDVAIALRVNAFAPLTVRDAGTGTSRIVTDQFINVIGAKDAAPDVYISTLDARRRDLESAIASRETSGALAQAQARDLRAELDRVARLQAEQQATLGYADALPLAVSLDYVGNQIQTKVPTYGYAPLINNSRFVVSGGRVIMIDDLMVRRAQLQSRIAREFAIGRISENQVNILRTEMSRIAGDEDQLRTKGSLTFKDSRKLYQEFDAVQTRLDNYVAAGGQTPLSSR